MWFCINSKGISQSFCQPAGWITWKECHVWLDRHARPTHGSPRANKCCRARDQTGDLCLKPLSEIWLTTLQMRVSAFFWFRIMPLGLIWFCYPLADAGRVKKQPQAKQQRVYSIQHGWVIINMLVISLILCSLLHSTEAHFRNGRTCFGIAGKSMTTQAFLWQLPDASIIHSHPSAIKIRSGLSGEY